MRFTVFNKKTSLQYQYTYRTLIWLDSFSRLYKLFQWECPLSDYQNVHRRDGLLNVTTDSVHRSTVVEMLSIWCEPVRGGIERVRTIVIADVRSVVLMEESIGVSSWFDYRLIENRTNEVAWKSVVHRSRHWIVCPSSRCPSHLLLSLAKSRPLHRWLELQLTGKARLRRQ